MTNSEPSGLLSRLGRLFSDDTGALVRRLIADYGRDHWKAYVAAAVCMAAMAASTSLSAWLMRDVINKTFLERDVAAVWMLAGAIVVLYSIKGVATYGQQVILARISNAIVAAVQRRTYDHLLAMDVPYYASRHTSDFVMRLSFVAQACGGVLNTLITAIGRDFLSLAGLLVVMLVQDPVMSLVGFAVMPVAIFGVQHLVRKARRIMYTEFAQGLAVTEVTQETVRGIKVVKAYGLERSLTDRVFAAVDQIEAASNRLASVGARTAPLMETLGGFAVAGVILYGGWRVVDAGRTPGEFFSFITALLLAYEPAKRLARVHVDLAANLVGVKMMYDLFGEPAKEPPEPEKPALRVTAGEIRFEGIRFAYRPDEIVFDGLDLVAEPGETTALVGRSGGGKSTILALLLRFWTPTAGRITIDGQSIDAVERGSLRRAIAYVGQEAHLFKGTIRDNIRLGRLDADDAAIEAAARAAHAHHFIVEFQDGYDTQVGENGIQLSGGQRQRIAIARAILKDAPILLLDEATAALDTESERAIQAALAELSQGRTTLVIAHRLQTIERADAICVVEGGRVSERGTHAEMMAAGGRYAALQALMLR